MLKHCHNSSIRLARRCPSSHPDTVSLNSTLTVHSSCGSSESNTSDSAIMNSSFQILGGEAGTADPCYSLDNNNYAAVPSCARAAYNQTPDPASLSSRASSYASLAEGVSGPRTTVKVYASCLREDITYKTLSVAASTTARAVIWQLLAKYKMKHRDPRLFFLTLEVVIQKPARDGLTKKTLVLDDDSKPAELKNCTPWGECRFVLQMKKGGVVKIHDSVLMEESRYKCLLISEDTSVEEVVTLLLHCYGLERVERAGRYCLHEQCTTQRYTRRLGPEERPLQVQALWPGPTQFCFVLKRAPAPASIPALPAVAGSSVTVVPGGLSWHSRGVQVQERPSLQLTEERPRHGARSGSVESGSSGLSSGAESEAWPELDKEEEQLLASDMDTSLSSHSSPSPPPPPPQVLTSTPLHPAHRPRLNISNNISNNNSSSSSKPAMSFLFPSPDYASFPGPLPPCRPYSSAPSPAPGPAPSLPPKPVSLVAGVQVAGAGAKCGAAAGSSCHDYENYFFI